MPKFPSVPNHIWPCPSTTRLSGLAASYAPVPAEPRHTRQNVKVSLVAGLAAFASRNAKIEPSESLGLNAPASCAAESANW